MNVEQLISEGKEKHNICEVNSSRAFEAGVRHAIAAMFEVVKVEDLKEGGCYFAYCPQQGFGWSFAKLDHSGEFACVDINGTMEWWPQSHFSEFRRCPTPGDVWIETKEESR